MIQIYQGQLNMGHFPNIVNKHSEVEVDIAVDFLDSDIQKLQGILNDCKSSYERKDLTKTLNILNKLKAKTVDGKFTILWVIDKNKVLRSYPIDLAEKLTHNIKVTDYIKNFDGMYTLKLDYSEALELIAFDMMYRDLGFTREDIEEKLSNIGLTSISPASIILNLLEGESAIEDSSFMKIESSPYATTDAAMCNDYFNIKMFDSGNYKDCVDFSCRYAMTAIASDVLQIINTECSNYNLCSISNNSIYIMLPDNVIRNIKDKIEQVVIRVFGRKFNVMPNISII